MNILAVHNYYQQPGGEDGVFAEESELLQENGHRVVPFTVHNGQVEHLGKLALARKTLFNKDIYAQLREIIRKEGIEVAHFHNTFPLISPGAYYAAKDEGVRVVQTLHNYRLLCPSATFFRDGHVCEDCLGKSVPWPGVVHRCYRGSLPVSAITAAMLTHHRWKGTWQHAVDVYIALTQFAKNKFVEGGLPESKIVVKPNFVRRDPGPGDGSGGYAIFVGRLSPEKGINTLLKAWTQNPGLIPLKILGDGPMRAAVEHAVGEGRGNIEWLGRKEPSEVLQLISKATCLIFPSVWYETFGRVATEAFAVGTPVVASRLGAMAELVEEGKTGRLFEAGNPGDLAAQVTVLSQDKDSLAAMRSAARICYERLYTPKVNLGKLLGAYQTPIS